MKFGNVFLTVVGVLVSQTFANAQTVDELPDSPRVTPAVRVIRQTEPAVVALFQVHPSGNILSGSGTIIHPSGIVLTNNHVLKTNDGYALIGSSLPVDQKPVRFSVIGRNPERDLAVVSLRAPGPFPVVGLGRSHDLLNGEPVVVAGNPGGRGTVFSSGIISSKLVLSGAPNALVMTHYRNSRRPRYIQFDAASNGGNSGGPLINMEGKLIGIVSQKIYQEQNIGFAIPVDDVFQLIDGILEPEVMTGKSVGIELAPGIEELTVESVGKESPAAKSGIEVGDQLTSLNGLSLQNRVDWFTTLRILLDQNRGLKIGLRRGENQQTVNLEPAKLKPTPATDVDEATLKPGLSYQVIRGEYSLVPDFSSAPVHSSGIATSVSLSGIDHGGDDHFAIRMNGFLKLPEDSLYRIVVVSDDGSKVYLHDKAVIDNDGNHPALGAGRLMYLQKGMHPIRIEYFQGNGDKSLELVVQVVGQQARLLKSKILFHVSDAASKETEK